MAMGIFEGHMSKMAEGFKTIRKAEMELSGAYDPDEHDNFFTYFNWEQFSNENGCFALRWWQWEVMVLCTILDFKTCHG